MAVVTVSRQYGSGGRDLARRVADLLGARYVDSELIAEAARRVGAPADLVSQRDERVQSQAERLLESLRLAFTGLRRPTERLALGSAGVFSDAEMLQATRLAIKEVAADGNAVIVGRGAQMVLRNEPATIHVHVIAPLDQRIETVMKRRGISREAARQRIAEIDNSRAEYLHTNYQADWEDPSLYHLTLNMGLLSQVLAAEVVVLTALTADANRKQRCNIPGLGPQENERLVHSLNDLARVTAQICDGQPPRR